MVKLQKNSAKRCAGMIILKRCATVSVVDVVSVGDGEWNQLTMESRLWRFQDSEPDENCCQLAAGEYCIIALL